MSVPAAIEAAAQALYAARRAGTRIGLISQRWPQFGIDEARAVAQRFVALGGEKPTGFKLGYTSTAMREQMNIAEPNYGVLTEAMACERLDWSRLVHPRAEPEIALITAKPIESSRDVSLAAIASVHAAIEIVDTRYTEYRFTLIDNTADNSSAVGFTLGSAHPPCALEAEPISVTFDDGEGGTLSGNSAEAMGGPLQALAWFADARAKQGQAIPAGSIILTGGLTKAPFLKRGQPLIARFAGLGAVSVEWN